MDKIHLETNTVQLLSDTYTPVGIYLRLRDLYTNSLLLESSDFHTADNSWSFICLEPLLTFSATKDKITLLKNNALYSETDISNFSGVAQQFDAFINSFTTNKDLSFNGLYGYTSYDAVQYFETIRFDSNKQGQAEIPLMHYSVFRFIIAINHFNDELIICENKFPGEESRMQELRNNMTKRTFNTYPFTLQNDELKHTTDEQFLEMIKSAQEECVKGNVIQMVLSHRFSQKYNGDEFNVYRMLRSINPSPYLFYFDFGSFRLFGSSPETHLQITNGKATINPIAGTYKRSGNDETDRQLAEELRRDAKENAEHVMLVDLARNDLSRYANHVDVEVYKEIQFYSHVIHLVSKVSGNLKKENSIIQLFGSTFPAGTLSGAPKYMAMKLIDKLENHSRSFYGGAIGFIGFNRNMNHAITIRSILSTQNTLYYQAGAGVVAASQPESELQEVNNKLGALRKAIQQAQNITL